LIVDSSIRRSDAIDWQASLPFLAMHLACFSAIWTGVSWKAAALCFALYVIRMFGITAGYHRYFSHRSYRTGRVFQFVLACIGASALQKGPLWWAAHHRHHHQHSDQEDDIHSPLQSGFWWSHVGWMISNRYDETQYRLIQDFAKYPELRWLNRYSLLTGFMLAGGCFAVLGWQGLVWGFFISTVLLYHGTFAINSFCHIFGKVRYETSDTSRNSLILALITLGEGWHNNHHYYSTSTRMGFFWWEVDISYYVLRVLAALGIVWELKPPPERAYTSASKALADSARTAGLSRSR
jgi:stearoyl-CoA desaturase (Delta-9 desaturase)